MTAEYGDILGMTSSKWQRYEVVYISGKPTLLQRIKLAFKLLFYKAKELK